MANVDVLEPYWPDATTAGVQRWPRNCGIAPGAMDSLPTAANDYAGGILYVPGATTVSDAMYVGLKNANDTATMQRLATGRKVVVSTGGAYATPIVLTAANSGNLYLLNDAAGLDFTLPAIGAGDIGVTFSFRLTVALTSNNYRMTAATGDLLRGHITIIDKDTATGDANALISLFRPNESSHLVVTIPGTVDTGGRLLGGWLEFEAVTTTGWFVRGELIGDGALATVFS